MSHRLALTPHGRLFVEESNRPEDPDTPSRASVTGGFDSSVIVAFSESSARGLLALAGHREEAAGWSVETHFWRDFADTFLAARAHTPETTPDDDPGAAATLMPPGLGFDLTLRLPAMRGAEYATPEVFASFWHELDAIARDASADPGGIRAWLGRINPALHTLGKVTFHLAENKRSATTPFAFMATYTHRLSAQQKPLHLPLARALKDYAGAKNQAALRSLLEPVQRAAESSAWARELFESRRIFQPQAWTPPQAYALLREVPTLEAAGIEVRIPDWWKNGRGSRPRVSVSVGETQTGRLGIDSLLSFSVATTLDGEPLTPEDVG